MKCPPYSDTPAVQSAIDCVLQLFPCIIDVKEKQEIKCASEARIIVRMLTVTGPDAHPQTHIVNLTRTGNTEIGWIPNVWDDQGHSRTVLARETSE